MKSILKTSVLILFSSVLLISSCKKDDGELQLSDKIKNIISEDVLKDLKKRGMLIHDGTNPPSVEGIYLANNFTLTSPYDTSDSFKVGKTVADYKYKFYDQTIDDLKLDYKQSNDNGSGYGSYLSGSGKKFSLFTQTSGVTQGIAYKNVAVISGEMTENGIKNFQYALVLTEKTGDTTNLLIPVGKSRIWEDADKLAEIQSVFRMINPQVTISSKDVSTLLHK